MIDFFMCVSEMGHPDIYLLVTLLWMQLHFFVDYSILIIIIIIIIIIKLLLSSLLSLLLL